MMNGEPRGPRLYSAVCTVFLADLAPVARPPVPVPVPVPPRLLAPFSGVLPCERHPQSGETRECQPGSLLRSGFDQIT